MSVPEHAAAPPSRVSETRLARTRRRVCIETGYVAKLSASGTSVGCSGDLALAGSCWLRTNWIEPIGVNPQDECASGHESEGRPDHLAAAHGGARVELDAELGQAGDSIAERDQGGVGQSLPVRSGVGEAEDVDVVADRGGVPGPALRGEARAREEGDRCLVISPVASLVDCVVAETGASRHRQGVQ